MNKPITTSLLFLAMLSISWAENYISPKKHVTLAESSNWVITEMPSIGNMLEVLSMRHVEDNLHVHIQVMNLEPAFDITMPTFVENLRSGLEAAGMQVTDQEIGEFQGHKAVYVYAKQPLEVPDSGVGEEINVVSISFFIDDKTFVTLSYGGSVEKILEHADVKALTKHLSLRG